MAESDTFFAAVNLAVGGWKVDPSDPWKRPYSPENAALAAAKRYGVEDRAFIQTLTEIVEREYKADRRRPEDYR